MSPTPTARVRTAALVAALLVGLTACGGTTKGDGDPGAASGGPTASADPDAPLREGVKMAFLPKQLNNPYSDIEGEGGKEGVEELKGEFKLVGPNDASASSQVSYINTLIQQQQDVIGIAANDQNAVCPSLKQAREAGIKVVSFDSDAAKDCRDVFVNQATAQGIGEKLVEMASQLAGGSGEIAVLSATPNATNQNAWIAVVETELAKPQNSGLKLVKTVYGNDDDQKSFQEAQGLLQAHPDLEVIVAPTTVGIAAAARYVGSSSYKGKVAVTGLGTPNQMREHVKNGTVERFALWDPADIGYLAAHAGVALASGRITGAQGEEFTAGRLGDYTIGADGEVVLGPPTVFDAANIDQFDF
ncbi:rhamnose ABC transporter substrate-binding protein [Actinosynnema pretiosum subsp. pretiosum]|uniref:Rhamnose ABC transporter, periplasmic rhamnose-binding protein n=2 Tax=Actinosynnema TaxID=40566 RepID=C6WRX1_ACTMD|nr:rhamnose ABC transporter substrate-binding protein [Actinosynnema mirum]ACU36963.1 rhamnose ABC transporter, periplasmic rhamnose- binding protein [Actinosynnema mirum DSM 43827]AXX30443.1 putative L-rhamnose ABC transporter, substrate-binding component [Actinosynnema pretiosum subsp. pretiosum]QUF05412.1 rhamnose ABC transporter substrate-binding protein [Actinosynnema pretiosum subsp. pretiosum]